MLSILLTFLSSFIVAQECNVRISGRVLDKATREPLEFSSIAVQEGNRYVIADSVGYFMLDNLCPGQFHIQVNHLGCPPGVYFLTVRKDTFITFFLDHHAELLREILVEGKPGAFNESQNRQSISSALIRNEAGKSLAEITDQVAGVRTLRNGSGISKPIIHGLTGNRIAIVNNGLLQAGQQWGSDHAPEVDPNAATIITVVKGSDAIEYGSLALGGALIIEAGPIPHDPHLHGHIGYAFESNGLAHALTARLSKTHGKLDWRWTGTVKKSGDRQSPDYFLTNTGASEWNTALQMIYRSSEKVQHQLYYSLFTARVGIFAGSHISNLTDLEEAIGRETPFRVKDHFSYMIEAPKQHVYHHLWKYSGKKFIDEYKFLDWSYGLQSNHREEFDIRRGDRSEIPALDLQLWAHALQMRYINNKGSLKFKTGGQLGWTDNTNNYDTGILPLIPDYQKASAGVYGMFQYPAGRFVFEGGARYDVHALKVWAITFSLPREIIRRDHLLHDAAVSLGAQFKPASEMETRLQNVFARRSPEPNELYSNGLHQGVAGIEEGNWFLQPEHSFKSMLTQSVGVHNLLRMELSIYSHLIWQYIYLKPEDEFRLTIRGAFPVYVYTQEDAWIRGLDVVLISDFSHHVEWSSKVSFVRGYALAERRALSFIPPTYLTSLLSWSFHDSHRWKGSRIQIEGEYTARQNHWDPESEWLPPPSDYFLLSARLTSGIKIRSRVLQAGIIIENILNAKYRNYLNRLRYFSDEMGRSINLQIRYEF